MLDGFSILPLKCSCFYAFVAAATRKVNKYNNNDPESVGFYEFFCIVLQLLQSPK